VNLKEKTEKGEKLNDILIIDAHSHMGKWFNFPIYGDPSARGMVRLMDRLGVSRCLSSAHLSIGPDFHTGNEMIRKAMMDFPGRFTGLCTVNPNYPDEVKQELELRFNQGFTGIKFHPGTHNYPVTGKNYRAAWEFAQERKLILLSHTWYDGGICSPRLFDDLAKAYPDVKILLGHSGGTHQGFEEAAEIAAKHKNVYLDMCGTEFSGYWIEYMVNATDPDKVVFGTDFPFHDPRITLGRVLYARLSDDIKKKILGLNIDRLLNRGYP